MQLSLVMPNLFDHGSGERQFGDLVRIDNDVSFGTWYDLSGGRQTWQPEWSQWNNPFLGFTGFSDISGRGQLILDGDPLIMQPRSPTTANVRAPSTSSPWPERPSPSPTSTTPSGPTPLLPEPRGAGPAERRDWSASRSSTTATDSSTTPRAGTPNAGSASCPTAAGRWPCSTGRTARAPRPSRSTSPPSSASTGPAAVRDLWAHQDLGSMTSYQVALAPHASVLLSVVPGGSRPFSGRGRGLGRIGPVREHLRRPLGHGLRHRPRHRGEQCGRGRLGAQRRPPPAPVPRGQLHRQPVEADRPGARPGDRRPSTARPRSRWPSTPAWTSWQTVPVTLTMAAGTNLVVCSVETLRIREGSISTTSPWPEADRWSARRRPLTPTTPTGSKPTGSSRPPAVSRLSRLGPGTPEPERPVRWRPPRGSRC